MRRLAFLLLVALGGAAALLLAFAIAVRRPTPERVAFQPLQRASAARLARDVHQLSEGFLPRDYDHPQVLEGAARYVERALRASGAHVESQRYAVRGHAYRNLIARFGPERGPRVIVGAHYDAFSIFGRLPGADDDASGAAGVLELARLLHGEALRRPVELVAFTLEEPPAFGSAQMGSRVHADSLARAGVRVEAMLCLEMIGYFSPRQPWPGALLGMIYPRRGDFVVVVGLPRDGGLARRVKVAMRAAGGPRVYSFNGPATMGTDASDHASYWRHGFPAAMVTDTAFLRNPNYHAASDTADTLDYARMARVVDGVHNAVLALAR